MTTPDPRIGATFPGDENGYAVEQHFADRVCLTAPGDKAATVYRYGSHLPKPCVHPLRTPSGGCLSGFETSDHPWHRGLWFAIKSLNEVNYWEEYEGCGRQQSIREPTVTLPDARSARIDHRIAWVSASQGVAMEEQRSLTFRWIDAQTRSIDWVSQLTPQTELVLDRTPYTTWGGYGGLAMRCSREAHNTKFQTSDGNEREEVIGEGHAWCCMNGQLDGGPERFFGIAMLDDVGNPRSPSPWYGKARDYNFLNAAFLFHEPMRAPQAVDLTLRYRVLYRDGHWTPSACETLSQADR